MKPVEITPIITALAFMGAQGVQGAEEKGAASMHPALNAKHVFVVGAYDQKADAEFRSSVAGLPEVELDFKELGVDDNDLTWMLEYRYRWTENWTLSVAAFTFDTSGSRMAEKDFNYDGFEFTAGLKVKTEVEVETYIVDALYTLYRNERAEILVGGGIHVFDISVGIEGKAFVGEALEVSAKAGSDDMLAPLPNLRAQAFYALSPKWAVIAATGWLSVTIDDYDGDFRYLHLRTTYRVTDKLGIGIGYQYLDFDVTHEQSRKEFEFDIGFDGPTLQLTYSL